ncbi:hypothetical protein ACFVRD_37945 [Streptomyces sp. NPDC057908]|uniref:hypothetical protein n=1 Tax=Streptomyces sp. NPDC057908 TaxID=3346276 RepID=UPI0036EA6897
MTASICGAQRFTAAHRSAESGTDTSRRMRSNRAPRPSAPWGAGSSPLGSLRAARNRARTVARA